MEKELETEFDIIVLGTGFTESLIASAAARIGKKVLHIDRNDYYGGQFASFSLTGLENWVNEALEHPAELSSVEGVFLQDGENIEKLLTVNSTYFGVKSQWHVLDVNADSASNTLEEDVITSHIEFHAENTVVEEKGSELDIVVAKDPEKETKNKIWSIKDLHDVSRKFNIDLSPKILFARGPLVELLISSNVARYLEFKCISQILTWMKSSNVADADACGHIAIVPCSRSDVFTSDVISLIEKRILMKFLQLCHSYEQHEDKWKEYSCKPFKEFLESQKLTPVLINFVINAIGMVDENVETMTGLKKTSHFLNSLGRYGAMPFLFSIYGSGEIPQAFCRLCAVFEGVYILRKTVEAMILNENKDVCGILSEGQRFKCKNLVFDINYAPQSYITSGTTTNCISRGIFVTNRSIMDREKEHLTLLRMPVDEENKIAVTVLEVGPSTGVSAPGTYLVHFIGNGFDAESDFKVTYRRIFSDEFDGQKPKVLFSMYFNQREYELSSSDTFPANIHICTGPDAGLDYDESISQARSIFTKLFPNDEFLPRAPDPDEIVFEGENATGNNTFDADQIKKNVGSKMDSEEIENNKSEKNPSATHKKNENEEFYQDNAEDFAEEES